MLSFRLMKIDMLDPMRGLHFQLVLVTTLLLRTGAASAPPDPLLTSTSAQILPVKVGEKQPIIVSAVIEAIESGTTVTPQIVPTALPATSSLQGPFTPKSIAAADPTVTALLVSPKSITTGDLTMTGLRMPAKTIPTGDLTMTGLRVPSKSITTGDLTMTGLRQ